MSRKTLTRRHLLKRAAATSTGALAFPYFVPASALGKDGAVAPSNRLVMGCIGVGGQGMSILKKFINKPEVQIVAVCDVNRESKTYMGDRVGGREPAKRFVEWMYSDKLNQPNYKGCASYADFRDLLNHKGIDAVTVVTPDHWHALASVAAANAGKDIYCEKPLANSIAEGRAICDAVSKNNRILQTGSHERSNDKGRYACELVRNGRIGKVHTVRINLPVGQGHHKSVMACLDPQPEMPIPDGFDYNMWLGHTPYVPYTQRRCHFWWRFILAYGGGEMTDRGAHVIDLAQLGMGTDDTGPVELKATGQRNASGIYDTFMTFKFEATYANGIRMIGSNDEPRGVTFEGDKGSVTIKVHGCPLEANPASLLEEKIGDNEIQLGRTLDHQQNFLDAVKSRKAPFAAAEIGHRTASICHLLNISMQLDGATLKWDPKAEKITNNETANKMTSRSMRAPWHL